MAASWECPSLPMLSFPLKDSTQTTFLGIKPMISAHYEEDGDSFQEEIKQLDSLRQTALKPPKDYNGVTMLRRYFGQLHLIRERFPPETIGQLPIDFVWKDAFTDTQYVNEGLQIEQASILYNISALHSMLGCRGKRSSEQEMKEAVTHFQCAAGGYSYLDENFAGNHGSRDLSAQFVSLYKDLMLGQAQECLVEKSLKGVGSRVKNLAIAKLAIRVSEYYLNVSRLLESEPCNVIVKKHKDWPKLLRTKIFYFQAISHFHQGCHSEELSKQGEQIAWLQLSLQKLTAIGKIPKSLGDMREAAKHFFDHVNDKLMAAKRQNDQVYHDPIPESDVLEQVTGAELVKPITFQPSDSKSVGRDIFARLVPMRAYEAASVYSEEKAKLLRSVVSSVQEKDEELEQYLLSLNAEEIDKLHQGAPSVPDKVLEQHKQLQGKSMVVKKLHSDIQELMKLSGEVSDDIMLIGEKRKEEVANEEEFQSRQGHRSPSQIMAALWKEVDNFSKFHSQASKSNGELKAMFDVHYQYLVLLSSPIATLQAAVPKLTALDTPTENSTDSARWKELMGKVDEMKRQRKALVGQLRDQINREDITKTLIGHLGSDKEVFIDEQMKPHREIADIIRKNLEAQENILRAVTEANAKKVQVRQTVQELTQQQEAMFAALVKAGTTFPLLESKIKEGLSFYTRLHGNVSKLRKRVLDVVATRQSERESVERRHTPDRSVSPDPSHLATPPPRPPKKAEFAGNPIAPEQQQPHPNQPHPPPGPPPPSGGQSTASPSHAHSPQPQATTDQSLEEQLQELQKQQTMQMQALHNLSMPSSVGDGLDLQSIQNVVPPTLPLPLQSQPGQSPQGVPQGGVPSGPPLSGLGSSPPVQHHTAQLPNVPTQQLGIPLQRLPGAPPGQDLHVQPPNLPSQQPEMPSQHLTDIPGQQLHSSNVPSQQPGMPSQHLSDVPGQQLHSLNVPTQQPGMQLPEVSGQPRLLSPETPTQQLMGVADHMTSPPPTSEQGGLINLLDTGSQPNLLQAPLQPTDPVLNQDSMRAIEDLQRLLQPPVVDSEGSASELQPPAEDSQEKVAKEDTLEQKQDLHLPQESSVNKVMDPISPPLLEQGASGGSESAPPQSVESNPPTGEGVVQNDSGSTLPDVLQVNTGQIELDKPDLDLPSSTDTHTLAPEHNLTSAEVTPPQPVSETTVIITAMSRPITTPIQVPPSSHTPSFSHDVAESHTHHPSASLSPTLSTSEGQFRTSPIPDISRTEPVGFQSVSDLVPTTLVSHAQAPEVEVESGEQTEDHSSLPTIEGQGLGIEQPTLNNQNSVFRPIPTPPTLQEVPGLVTSISHGNNLSSSTSSLPQLPDSIPMSSLHSIQSFPPPPLSLPTPPSVSPLPPELTMPLQEYNNLSSVGGQVNASHYESLLAKKDEQIDELKHDNENQKAQISDQRVQIESYKQQLVLLQQQVTQVSVQQQKYEQEKTASSGQQAVLMQLLQQQQGMFSQQQAQLENMSKVAEAHRKEQQELESSYKQLLAVEKEQKNNMQSQLGQQMQEMQRLQQQLQSQAQQYHTVQLQLHQYHSQIQERDKQLVAFREQHKQIIQTLDQKHQQKVSQLVQQLQEYQAEVKKLRAQRSGLMTPLQPVPAQQFTGQQQQQGMRPSRPASVPGQTAQAVNFPGQPANQAQAQHKPPAVQFNQTAPQTVRPPVSQPQNYPGGTPQGLPPPLQPTPSQGYGRQEAQQQQYQGFQQGQQHLPSTQQGGSQQSFQQKGQPPQQGGQQGFQHGQPPQQGSQQGFQQGQPPQQGSQQGFQQGQPPQQGTQQGFQQGQPPQQRSQQGFQPGQPPQQGLQQPLVPTPSTQTQSGGGGLMRQDSQQYQQQQQPLSKDVVAPTSSYGFVPRQENWQQPMSGGSRVPPTPSTPQEVMSQPGHAQYGQLPPGVPQNQTPHGPPTAHQQPQGGQLPPQQFQSPGGQFQPQPGGMPSQFSPAPQQPLSFSQQH